MNDRVLLVSGVVRVARACLLSLILLALAGVPVSAQSTAGFHLPIEVSQGAVFGTSAATTPYQASLSVLPTFAFDSASALRVGLKVALDYDNPSWRARFGGRISTQVKKIARADIGLLLSGEATTTVEGDVRVGAGLTFDVDGLIRVGTWGGYDELHDGAFFALTFGADVTSYSGCVRDQFDPSKCVVTQSQDSTASSEYRNRVMQATRSGGAR